MTRSFWGEFGQHLYHSAALVATLAGAVAGFVYARDYIWIPITLLIMFAAAVLFFCHRMHREKEEARQLADLERQRRIDAESHAEQERTRAREQVEAEKQQRLELEARMDSLVARKLNEYQRIWADYSFTRLVKELIAQLDFLKRMRLFSQSLTNPVEVRKVESFAGRLYIIAKLDAAAMKHLKRGDAFLLVEQNPAGLRAEMALLRLNQPPDPVHKLAHFLLEEAFGGAAEVLEALSRTNDPERLKCLVTAHSAESSEGEGRPPRWATSASYR